MAIVFVFLDGVGLAAAGPNNPLTTTPMPHVQRLLGGPLSLEHVQRRTDLLLQPIDAALGVAGAPQSGTGHVALLAGVNAPALHGRHQPNFPPTALRPLLAERSLLRRAREAGHAVAFANLFTPGYWHAVASRRIRRSASVIAAEGAGVRLRTLDDFAAGRALSWDITGQALHMRGEGLDLAPMTPEAAGTCLAELAHEHELVFFESFMSDLAGHGRLGPEGIGETLRRIDGLIGGLLDAIRPTDSLLITSDHGNLEDTSVRVHTEAAVPLLVVGPAAAHFAGVERIDQVADMILKVLQMSNLQPIRVLFVCMGNICRSPMAEAVFRHLVHEAGLNERFLIDSAGTGGWHAGARPHGGTLAILGKYKIDAGDQRARQLRAADFDQFDYILAMDHENMRDIAIRHPDVAQRVKLLLDYAPEQPVREVPDPYYDGGFEQVYQLITTASRNLLREIREAKRI